MSFASASAMGRVGRQHAGGEAEIRAERYLVERGYRLLARNVTYRVGEIDRVFELRKSERIFLVLVEVRMRSPGAWVGPEESVGPEKVRRLLRASDQFLKTYSGPAQEVRFDLVAVQGFEVRHFPGFIR